MHLNYPKQLLTLVSAIFGCVWISAFASLVGISVGSGSFSTGLKICAVTAVIKKYKSLIIKNKKNLIK